MLVLLGKLKFPHGIMWGTIYGIYKCIWVGNVFFFYTKVSFFENLMKKLIAAGVLTINMWFSVPIPKIKFDPPPQGKNALVLIF